MEELRLKNHFPRVNKECAVPGERFMDCFSKAATKLNAEDSEAGQRGLKACARELANYDACMAKALPDKVAKRYRVQEEYRKR
jgi:hypothetical protein